MNMTEKNGQPSMEEILASIRRIISEEPGPSQAGGEFRGTPITLKGDGVLEDAGDFDLPAIFRASPPTQTERPAPLLGRLTDAIRSATSAQPETRGTLNGDYGAEPVEAAMHLIEPAYAGLSSLKPVKPDVLPLEPLRPLNGGHAAFEPAPSTYEPARPVATASSGSPDGPKRVMAPFKDTHFLRMTPDASVPEPVPAPTPAPAASPAALFAAPPAAAPQPQTLSLATPPFGQHLGTPPPLPINEPPRGDMAEGVGTIEDTTADLLRPMLRQWLADNMPRMVEKALHIEIAESVKGVKKP